jgi:hypothetical protein
LASAVASHRNPDFGRNVSRRAVSPCGRRAPETIHGWRRDEPVGRHGKHRQGVVITAEAMISARPTRKPVRRLTFA